MGKIFDSSLEESPVPEKHSRYFGRMNSPTASALLKGACGDEMEFYLVIEHGRITDVRFFTQGCPATLACGKTVAQLAQGKTIEEALRISAQQVRDILRDLSEDYSHCAILAVSTLYKAIADYLLMP